MYSLATATVVHGMKRYAWFVSHPKFSLFLDVFAVSRIEFYLFSSPVAVLFCATVNRSSAAV